MNPSTPIATKAEFPLTTTGENKEKYQFGTIS